MGIVYEMYLLVQHYADSYPDVGVLDVLICDPEHLGFSSSHSRLGWWLYIFYLSKFYEVCAQVPLKPANGTSTPLPPLLPILKINHATSPPRTLVDDRHLHLGAEEEQSHLSSDVPPLERCVSLLVLA